MWLLYNILFYGESGFMWLMQSWGRLHANVIDYNYNYFEIS